MTKVTLLAEGRGDILFLAGLVKHLLGKPLEFQERIQSWPRLKFLIEPTVRQAHFEGSDFVIVGVYVDDSPWNPEHNCFQRHAEVSAEIRLIRAKLSANSALTTVVATAVPCREAWLDFLNGGSSSEASWRQLVGERPGSQLRQELKERVYRNARPDWAAEKAIVDQALAALPRLLHEFQRHFPSGLSELFQALR